MVSDTLVFKSAKSYVTLDDVGNNGKGCYTLLSRSSFIPKEVSYIQALLESIVKYRLEVCCK